MKEIRHLKTMKNKRNLNIKWLLLQSDQNADTTLLHSHDDLGLFGKGEIGRKGYILGGNAPCPPLSPPLNPLYT